MPPRDWLCSGGRGIQERTSNPYLCSLVLSLLVCAALAGCGRTASTTTQTNATNSTNSNSGASSVPSITSFVVSPTSINYGASITLSWATNGATTISISPVGFSSTSASGSTTVSPAATTTYTLTATNASGSAESMATVTVTAGGTQSNLTITTTSCPNGAQSASYAGCTISASGGSPPYTFSVSTSSSYPPLPEGMSLNASTGAISSSEIGGQGTYGPEFIVTDSKGSQATREISIAIAGSNAFLSNIFPSTSIFHHRVDAASTSLPVDTPPLRQFIVAIFPKQSNHSSGTLRMIPFQTEYPRSRFPTTKRMWQSRRPSTNPILLPDQFPRMLP